MTFDPTPYELVPGLLHWLVVFGGFAGIALLVGFVIAVATRGSQGPAAFFSGLGRAAVDFLHMSPRRIGAISTLTVREALRRKALLVFVVFAVLFMFAGWFLNDVNAQSDMQVKVYVSFVLRAINWLILPVILLLACWGLPEDIRIRSLHTVVTKPVRRNEVVLGRMLGYTFVGTMILLFMSGVGYVWIDRQVPSEAEDQLVSRVPVYGTMSFLDREGNPALAGVNTGDVWEFYSYIEGATKSRAIWAFPDITPDKAGEDGLTLEARFQAFRTHKGNMNRPLMYRYIFVNPEKGLRVDLQPQTVNEFRANVDQVPRKVSKPGESKEYDLYEDLVAKQATALVPVDTPQGRQLQEKTFNNVLTVEVEALDQGQFIGMARPNLFIRTPDRPFAAGYFKAIFGTWLMMVLIIVLGVTASTFTKGPVATMLTFGLIVVGQGFREFMEKLVAGQMQGSGTLESIYRILAHMNPQVPLPENAGTRIIQTIDLGFANFLWLVQHIVPKFDYFTMAPYVANGFDVPWASALLPSIVVTVAYIIPCVLLAYFCLQLRELESK